MFWYIFLAVFNGVIIGTSRALNGRLSMKVGPFKASFCNHLVGFLLLSLILVITLIFRDIDINIIEKAPLPVYLGGFIGALYVTINSFVLARIGATSSALLVISGQMIAGVLIDYQSGVLVSIFASLLGVAMIIFGVYLSKVQSKVSSAHSNKEKQAAS
jgi:transporter family-2 protein